MPKLGPGHRRLILIGVSCGNGCVSHWTDGVDPCCAFIGRNNEAIRRLDGGLVLGRLNWPPAGAASYFESPVSASSQKFFECIRKSIGVSFGKLKHQSAIPRNPGSDHWIRRQG